MQRSLMTMGWNPRFEKVYCCLQDTDIQDTDIGVNACDHHLVNAQVQKLVFRLGIQKWRVVELVND